MTDHRCLMCEAPFSGDDLSICPESPTRGPHRYMVRHIEFDHHDPSSEQDEDADCSDAPDAPPWDEDA